jgi:hypothetical protein
MRCDDGGQYRVAYAAAQMRATLDNMREATLDWRLDILAAGGTSSEHPRPHSPAKTGVITASKLIEGAEWSDAAALSA